MMVEMIITSGAAVGEIIQRFSGMHRDRPHFEKIMPGDQRGAYGEYLVWLSQAQAEMVTRRYSSMIRQADGAASIDEG